MKNEAKEALVLELVRKDADADMEVSPYSTVGCRRTGGINGPSLDRSYFSRLQPSRSYFSIHLRVTLLSL